MKYVDFNSLKYGALIRRSHRSSYRRIMRRLSQ